MNAPLNAQQVFNKVLTHLRKQGHAAVNGSACVYRAPNGDMCAFGCLIPDELYAPVMEGISASVLMKQTEWNSAESARYHNTLPGHDARLRALFDDSVRIALISELQRAHDGALKNYGMPRWEKEMREIAERYALSYTAP